ncbi:MAG: TolC family protein, partial [bacterium]
EYHNINNIYTAKVDIEKAENILEKEKIKLKQLEQNIYLQVRNQIHSLEKAWAGIVSNEKELERKNRELDAARLQYESGVISTRDIVDYQEKLADAENKLVQSKWDYNLALKEYYRVLGIDSLDMFIVLE